MNYTVTITREILVDVDLRMTYRGHPGVQPSLSYPGDPPEPPEFEIERVVALNGEALTPEEIEQATEKAIEFAYEDLDSADYE